MSKDPQDEVLGDMLSWIFGDDNLAQQMETFADTYCPYFDYVADRFAYDSSENKLVYTELYTQFQSLFESKVSGWLTSRGWTIDKLSNAFVATSGSDDKVNDLIEMIVALTDYNAFKIMMLDQRKKREQEIQQ